MSFTNDCVIQPSIEPVTLDEFKTFIRYDNAITTEDSLLRSLITTARQWAEDFSGCAMVDSVWRTVWADHDGGDLRLMRAPVLEVLEVFSVASDGSVTAIDDYVLHDAQKYPRLTGITTTGEIRVDFRAGFVDTYGSPTTGTLPEGFRTAIMFYAQSLYDRDKDDSPYLQKAAQNILRQLRVAHQFS